MSLSKNHAADWQSLLLHLLVVVQARMVPLAARPSVWIQSALVDLFRWDGVVRHYEGAVQPYEEGRCEEPVQSYAEQVQRYAEQEQLRGEPVQPCEEHVQGDGEQPLLAAAEDAK